MAHPNENLASILLWKYPQDSDVPELQQFEVSQDNEIDGPYISRWQVPGVNQPTTEEVMSDEPQWELENSLKKSHEQRIAGLELDVLQLKIAVGITVSGSVASGLSGGPI